MSHLIQHIPWPPKGNEYRSHFGFFCIADYTVKGSGVQSLKAYHLGSALNYT